MSRSVANLKIRDIMTAAPIAVVFADNIRHIMNLFISKKISGAAVIEPLTGKVLSIVSESDLMKLAPLNSLDMPLLAFKDKLPALADLITVHPEEAFSEVFKRLITKPVRRVLVVDHQMHLIGIVSRRDILKAFVESHD